MAGTNAGSPKGREPYGDTGLVVVVRVTPHQGGRESRPQGEGGQVMRIFSRLEVRVMQNAETVVDILRARGRRGLPCDELYRQLFNPALFLMFVDRTTGRHAGGGGCAGRALSGRSHATLWEEDAWHCRMGLSETWRRSGCRGGAVSLRLRVLCRGWWWIQTARWWSRFSGSFGTSWPVVTGSAAFAATPMACCGGGGGWWPSAWSGTRRPRLRSGTSCCGWDGPRSRATRRGRGWSGGLPVS